MGVLEDWAEALCAELGLDAAEGSQKVVLNLARVVAPYGGPAGRAADRLLPRPGGRPRATAGGNGAASPAACPGLVREPLTRSRACQPSRAGISAWVVLPRKRLARMRCSSASAGSAAQR